jgi:hypothetical protein
MLRFCSFCTLVEKKTKTTVTTATINLTFRFLASVFVPNNGSMTITCSVECVSEDLDAEFAEKVMVCLSNLGCCGTGRNLIVLEQRVEQLTCW